MPSPSVLFRPGHGWVGDVIPFFYADAFWLYYLHDRRTPDEPGMSWGLVRTGDLIAYQDLGVALPHGGPRDQDLNAYTGSVVRDRGAFHLFYTGYNPELRDASGVAPQAVMHAVGTDLRSWQKCAGDTFLAPDGYERHDWRDPFVFRDPRTGHWTMLLAARERVGSPRRRGCIASLTSTDLTTWTPGVPFWSPNLYLTHECPDLATIGDWHYLIYSEFSERNTTRYRMSRSLDGPWSAAPEDSLDGRAFYAAKTATDGQRTFAFGWLATKAGETDDGAWEWGGELLAHELVQQPDGTLAVRLPEQVRRAFTGIAPRAAFDRATTDATGPWVVTPDGLAVGAHESYASLLGPSVPGTCLISASLTFDDRTRACGLWIGTDDNPDDGYFIRLEPLRDRVVFDRWPRQPAGELEWQIGGDIPHAVELERSVRLDPRIAHRVDVLMDGTALIAYIDGRVAMSARAYDTRPRRCGWFVSEGALEVNDITIRTLAAQPPQAFGGGLS